MDSSGFHGHVEIKLGRTVQLADDTVAELEAMRTENIQLSSKAVVHDGELQACKQALAKLTSLLEVRHTTAITRHA